jgi:hypothetical protein
MAVAAALPRWDMDVFFPGLDSEEFGASFRAFVNRVGRLEEQFDREGIDKGTVSADPARIFDAVVSEFNSCMDDARLLNAYVSAHTTTDSRNQLAQARASEMDYQLVRVRKLGKRLTGWMGGLDVPALVP